MIAKRCIWVPAALLFSASAAADWSLTPGLLLQESYNDNLTLVDEGERVSDFITELTPTIGIVRRGRKLDMTLNYRMQNMVYAKESQHNRTYSQFRGNATANVVQDLFFIDAAASYGQQNISNAGTITLDNASINRNRTNSTVATVRPYIDYRLGRTAELYLSAERGSVRYSAPELQGSDRNSYEARLSSGTAFRRMLWRLSYLKQDISAANQTNTTLQEYNAGLEYRLTPRLALLATSGYDSNEYERPGSVTNPRGSKWSAGFNWVATRRTSVEATVGKRYFGDTRSLTLSHRARRAEFSLTYDESVTVLATTLFAANEVAPPSDTGALEEGAAPVLDTELDPSLPSVSNAAYVRKRLTGNISLRSAQSLLTLTLFDESRLYELTAREEVVQGGTASFNWNFSPRSRALLSVTGQYSDLGDRGTNKFLRASAGFERRLGPRLVSNFTLSHNRQNASLGRLNYDQNIAYARIVWEL